MKLAFMFGPVSAGNRPFDFSRIEDDPRGLTGTDGSFLGYARVMADRGHSVSIFAQHQRDRTMWEGCRVHPYEDRTSVDGSFEAALAWNDLAALGDVSPECVRIVDMQVNDFTYVRPEEHRAVDLYLMPGESRKHLERMRAMAERQGATAPFGILPNGCDPTVYGGPKEDGLMIWASSPDRGLHNVLEQLPALRAAVPGARLRVFYHSLAGYVANADQLAEAGAWQDREHGRRARIIRSLLSQPGVEVVGGVSRREMAAAYSAARVLAYPVDTVAWTEGFAVAICEGCASGAIPVVTDCDAIGEVYAGACPVVSVRDTHLRFVEEPWKLDEWSNLVVRGLVDEDFRADWVERGRQFAREHSWPVLGSQLESIIEEARRAK